MKKQKRFYAAYGSNTNFEQMAKRCPNSSYIGHSKLDGYALVFKGSKTGSYLTLDKDDKGSVEVALWEVTPGDELNLDMYEGYPIFYQKHETVCELDGKPVPVFFYSMNKSAKYGLPSRKYVSDCAKGFKNCNMDISGLDEALKRTKQILKAKKVNKSH